MFRKANNVFSVILDNETVAPLGAGNIATDTTLPAGAIAVVNLGMTVLDAAAYAALPNGAQFKIVQGKGAGVPMMQSPVLTKGKVTITSAKHVASAQQITAIGFNGTTGSLPSANDTSYYIKVRKNDNDEGNRSQPFSLFGQYKTSGSADQEELALGLAINLTKNMADEPANGYLKVEILSGEASVDVGDAADTVVGTKGSTVVTLTDTGGDNTIASIVAGDYFRVGTATTDEVYKIVAVSAGILANTTGTITLDRALTQDVNLVGNTAGFITEAAATAGNFGIRLTGVENPFNVNSFRNFFVNRFTATFSDDDTLITHLQGAREGVGVWQRVALDEYMSYGFEGQNEMINTPPMMRDQAVKIPGVGGATAATSKYSVVNISWTEDIDGLVSKAGGKGNVLIYLNLDGSGNLGGAGSSGEAVAKVLGLTPANLDE